jgi:hypothetical protein
VKQSIGPAAPSNNLAGLVATWVPPLLISLFILLLSGELGAGKYTLEFMTWLIGQPQVIGFIPVQWCHDLLRKTAHPIVYGCLGFFSLRAVQRYREASLRRPVLLVLVYCFLVALLDEGHQSFNADRDPRFTDLVLDITGAALCAGMALVLDRAPKRQPGPGGRSR